MKGWLTLTQPEEIRRLLGLPCSLISGFSALTADSSLRPQRRSGEQICVPVGCCRHSTFSRESPPTLLIDFQDCLLHSEWTSPLQSPVLLPKLLSQPTSSEEEGRPVVSALLRVGRPGEGPREGRDFRPWGLHPQGGKWLPGAQSGGLSTGLSS